RSLIGYDELDEVTVDAPAAARALRVSGLRSPDADADRSDTSQRVAGVDAEIQQDLLELNTVGNHRRDVVELHVELQRRRHRPANERKRVRDQRGKRDSVSLATPSTTEHEQLLDQVPRTMTRCSGLLEVAGELRVADGFLAVGGEPDVAEHCRQDVVAVMFAPRGQLADRLHLLGLP